MTWRAPNPLTIQAVIQQTAREALAVAILAGTRLAAPTPQNCPNWKRGCGVPRFGADGSVQALDVLDPRAGPQRGE